MLLANSCLDLEERWKVHFLIWNGPRDASELISNLASRKSRSSLELTLLVWDSGHGHS